MLPTDTLVALSKTAESQYLERKRSCPDSATLRSTLCAFANSTPESQYSVLFIGIDDDGAIIGAATDSVDGTQQKIIKIARDDCYPPIHVVPQVVQIDGKTVLAIIVEHSRTTPHFTGHAFVRRGPTTEKASPAQYDELVLQRTSKVARLLREKQTGSLVQVRWLPSEEEHKSRGSAIASYLKSIGAPYRIEECDAFVIQLFNTSIMRKIAIPVDQVTISYSTEHNCTLLLIDTVFPGNA